MTNMRPGVKIKFWSPRYTNRPDVVAPGLLRIFGGFSIFSVIGFLVFAIGHAFLYSNAEGNELEVLYATVLHFALPLAVFYLVTSNSPLSRHVIALYVGVICGATIAGKGYLGGLDVDPNHRLILCVAVSAAMFGWLYLSPKMRYYFAAVSGKPIPIDLAGREEELQPKDWLTPKAKAALAWFLDHLETSVLLGFIGLTIYAYVSMW